MIKYLGSKRTLLPVIVDAVRDVAARTGATTVSDLFAGTSRVGMALKHASGGGFRVLANDHNAYAHALARCYIEADAEDVLDDARKLVDEFNALPGRPGYFTATFCENARFFHPSNGERIDAVREAIAAKGLPPDLEAVMLVSLMEAADRVDSTTGVQMAYLKSWAPRAKNPLLLRVPELLPRAAGGKGAAFCLDAFEAAKQLEADIAYIDPPYNQHSYLGNYHVWESLVRWDKPEVFGIACKRVDVKARRSVFNSRPQSQPALARLFEEVRSPVLVVSFNDEGFISRGMMEETLTSMWGGQAVVRTIAVDSKRYVGAKIGIHNPKGEKVGTVKHLTNTEFVFVVGRSREIVLGPGRAREGGPRVFIPRREVEAAVEPQTPA
ncbi:MAG: DNA adenine methylase [Phycisphaerales bacterium]